MVKTEITSYPYWVEHKTQRTVIQVNSPESYIMIQITLIPGEAWYSYEKTTSNILSIQNFKKDPDFAVCKKEVFLAMCKKYVEFADKIKEKLNKE